MFTPLPQVSLQGRRILVVENEYMIAQEIAQVLSSAGAETIGPVATVNDAVHLITSGKSIDGALLDVNLGNEAIWPVVDILMASGVPLVLATGYDLGTIPKTYARLPYCEKPASGSDLLCAVARAMTERRLQ